MTIHYLIQNCKTGLGEYQLHSVYESAAKSVEELDLIKCYPLDEIGTGVCCKYKVNLTMKEEDKSNSQSDTVEDSNSCTGKLYFNNCS